MELATVVKKGAGGRPPLSKDGSTVVSVRLPNSDYVALRAFARRQRLAFSDFNLSKFIRDAIYRELRVPPADR